MANTKHVVLIHGTWLQGDSWADTRSEFERRGFTVHTPTLRFHDLPREEGAQKMRALSLRDYADDLVGLVEAAGRYFQVAQQAVTQPVNPAM